MPFPHPPFWGRCASSSSMYPRPTLSSLMVYGNPYTSLYPSACDNPPVNRPRHHNHGQGGRGVGKGERGGREDTPRGRGRNTSSERGGRGEEGQSLENPCAPLGEARLPPPARKDSMSTLLMEPPILSPLPSPLLSLLILPFLLPLDLLYLAPPLLSHPFLS